MAGTKQAVEGLVGLVAQTVLTSASNEKNSLEGIDVSGLQDRATCYVREFLATYRYFDDSVLPVLFPFIVAPAVGPGRWILVATDLILLGGNTDYVDAGIEDLTLASTQALGPAGTWVDLVTPPWVTNQQGFGVPSNGFWEYLSTVPKQFLMSAKVSLAFGAPLSVSVGVGRGLPDPHPQTDVIPGGPVSVQIESERVDVLYAVASGGAPASVQLRSNGVGGEVVTVVSAQMVITPV